MLPSNESRPRRASAVGGMCHAARLEAEDEAKASAVSSRKRPPPSSLLNPPAPKKTKSAAASQQQQELRASQPPQVATQPPLPAEPVPAPAAVGAREGASVRTVREGRAPRYKSVATRIRKLSSRAFQLLHSVTSSSPRNAQDAGVVIPFRKLKSKHDFSMSQGPMWQFLPPYLVAQDVHVHAVVVPPTVPPLMQ